jgi:hypothetical protein
MPAHNNKYNVKPRLISTNFYFKPIGKKNQTSKETTYSTGWVDEYNKNCPQYILAPPVGPESAESEAPLGAQPSWLKSLPDLENTPPQALSLSKNYSNHFSKSSVKNPDYGYQNKENYSQNIFELPLTLEDFPQKDGRAKIRRSAFKTPYTSFFRINPPAKSQEMPASSEPPKIKQSRESNLLLK